MSQERYASSVHHEQGLLGNLVAKRAKAIKRPADRALIYWLQARSHDEGGLSAFAERFLAAFPERIGTPTMRRLGVGRGRVYSSEEVSLINRERPSLPFDCFDVPSGEAAPEGASTAFARCLKAAENLPEHLKCICLDPAIDLAERDNDAEGVAARQFRHRSPFAAAWNPNTSYRPSSPSVWWFEDLIGALHEYRRRLSEEVTAGIAETVISRQVFEDLDYLIFLRDAPLQVASKSGLVIIEGHSRTGKSTAAATWCAAHAGEAVYVKLESGTDDATFFRAIARSIGTASSAPRTGQEMRLRIQDMLQERHLVLVVDEGHLVWPQQNRQPRSAPGRVDWIRTALIDYGVPVALINTPQFDRQCDLFEKRLGWNAAQIRGRVKLRRTLPGELPDADLRAVALKMIPYADEASLLRLVAFANISEDYLAGIERIAGRALFFAERDRRTQATAKDIRRALEEYGPTPQPVKAQAKAPSRTPRPGAFAMRVKARCKAPATCLPATDRCQASASLTGPDTDSEAPPRFRVEEAALG